ncbi:MAG TPA: antibiotic biosynthesis monooxygenase [Saprospiraceae bacterium]|nr:antibiotic biosynthesis monooxygenase [Saprospiraceae bacterium]
MIIRIVKMVFQKETAEDFIPLFGEIQSTIENFKGCKKVMLLRDTQNTGIFFTYSIWDSAESLEEYRNSTFFKNTWRKTKSMFAKPAEAWSLKEEMIIPL